MSIVETTYSMTYLEWLHEPAFNSKTCGNRARSRSTSRDSIQEFDVMFTASSIPYFLVRV